MDCTVGVIAGMDKDVKRSVYMYDCSARGVSRVHGLVVPFLAYRCASTFGFRIMKTEDLNSLKKTPLSCSPLRILW